MTLLPLWSKRIKPDPSGRDPLGLSRVSEFIVSELLPGITLLTNVGRNYIFYCWAVNTISKSKINSYQEFSKKISRYESAYVIGSLLDAELNFPGGKGPIGRNRGTEAILTAKEEGKEDIGVNFSVLAGSSGGFGPYYSPAMRRLNLIMETQSSMILTPTGTSLAEIFESDIQNTEYFDYFKDHDQIPIDVLRKYGSVCSHLRLKEFSAERNALCEVLFAQHQSYSQNNSSRKATLLVILKLTELLSKTGTSVTDGDLREIIYYGHIVKNQNKSYYVEDSPFIIDTLKEWRFFLFHEHFTFALESLLASFINTLEDNPQGLSPREFITLSSEFPRIIEEYLDCTTQGMSIQNVISRILEIKKVPFPLTKNSSELFDKQVGQDDILSESNLRREITDSLKKDEYSKAIGLSILLLLILYVRYEQYQNNGLTNWIRMREHQNLSLYFFKNSLQPKITTQTLTELFYEIFLSILNQHNIIAHEKFLSGNDTYRFQEQIGDRYVFRMSYEPASRTDRFNAILSIFEDLGLIEKENDLFLVSSFGKEILLRYSK